MLLISLVLSKYGKICPNQEHLQMLLISLLLSKCGKNVQIKNTCRCCSFHWLCQHKANDVLVKDTCRGCRVQWFFFFFFSKYGKITAVKGGNASNQHFLPLPQCFR